MRGEDKQQAAMFSYVAMEREAALKMLKRIKRGKAVTLGADKSYQQET